MVTPPSLAPLTILLGISIVAALIAIADRSRRWTTYPSRIDALLASRWAPGAAGLITFVIVWIVWGSLDEPGISHDERAYLLQAQIFAKGWLKGPSPPVPAFFEQVHVFVQPAVFAKYPPAHAITLVPGIWLHLPGLVPALLAGVSGALIFWIARRLANGWVALLTWWLWATAWANLMWSTSYFSESTSGLMWLIAVWATIRWEDSRRSRYLLVVAASLGWGLLARPLTIAALSLPLGFVIVRRSIRLGTMRTLAAPLAAGALILLLQPLWNATTMGSWRLNPYSYYSEVYFPFDKPGFGVDPSPPLRPLPPQMAALGGWSRDIHQDHVLSSLPRIFLQRIAGILAWCSEDWRLGIGTLIVLAALRGRGAERFGVITILLLVLAYLSFAHLPLWTLYYVEVFPILFFLAASELGRLLHVVGGTRVNPGPAWPAPVANAACAAAVLLLPFGVSDVIRVRSAVNLRNTFHRAARAAVDAIPPGRAIVFVRYPPSFDPHLGLTGNAPDFASAERWLVHDLGDARNAELCAAAPGRTPYRLDAATLRVDRLSSAAHPF